jgi:hypothetical protein
MSDLTPNDRNEPILPQQWRRKTNTFDDVRVRVQMSDLTPNDRPILPQQWRRKTNTFDDVRVRVQMSDLTPNDMTPNDDPERQQRRFLLALTLPRFRQSCTEP